MCSTLKSVTPPADVTLTEDVRRQLECPTLKSVTPPADVTLTEDVRRQLECPVCHACCTPPIYMCPNSHHVCTTCHARTRRCPVCRSDAPKMRNLFAEGVSDALQRPCPNADEGCPGVYNARDMAAHLPHCGDQTGHTCWIVSLARHGAYQKTCPWRGPRHKLLAHVTSAHKGRAVRGNTTAVSWRYNGKTLNHYVQLVEADDRLFWVIVCYWPDRSVVHALVRLVGGKGAAARYSFEVQMRSADRQVLTFSSPVSDLNELGTECSKSLRLHKDMLQSFAADSVLKCKITIQEGIR